MKNITPQVGMGATLQVGSDRYPYTIVEIRSPKEIVIRQDFAKRVDSDGAFTENQEYVYSPDVHAPKIVLTLRRNGRWVRKYEGMNDGFSVSLGHREAYSDPCF